MCPRGSSGGKTDSAWIETYLEGCGEMEWARLVSGGHEEVSLLVHLSLLGEYLRSGMMVLELGPGPGRCTKLMGEIGCRVVAADSSHLRLRHHATRARGMGYAGAVKGRLCVDLADLHPFRTESFDAVVCYLGPISCELLEVGVALKECSRVCRPGGLVVVSALSLWGAVGRYVEGGGGLLEGEEEGAVARLGLRSDGWFAVSHRCQMFRARDLRGLVVNAGLNVLAVSASNALSMGWEALLGSGSSDRGLMKELVRLELEACREEGNLDMGTHIIMVGGRPRGELECMSAWSVSCPHSP